MKEENKTLRQTGLCSEVAKPEGVHGTCILFLALGLHRVMSSYQLLESERDRARESERERRGDREQAKGEATSCVARVGLRAKDTNPVPIPTASTRAHPNPKP